MKKNNFKKFWSIALGVITVVGILFSIATTVLVGLIFAGLLTVCFAVLYPVLPYIPVVQRFSLYLYEMKLNILRVLRMAKLDPGRRFGWMTSKEILTGVQDILHDGKDHRFWFSSLLKDLIKENAILMEGGVPVAYLKNPPTENGFATAYRLKDDFNYRPKKPRCLPKEKKGRQKVYDGLNA